MDRNIVAGAAAAVVIAVVLMILNENDFDQVPPTDTADVVATFAALGGAVVWLALRWVDPDKPGVRFVRALAVGVALGAIVVGLGSVVYDPWAP